MQQEQQAKQTISASALLEVNPQLKQENSVFLNIDTQIRESKVSSYVRQMVNDAYDTCNDLSLHSTDIEQLLLTDEVRAALGSPAFNFLLSFDLEGIEHTLDLSQDFGGVTHFLANKVHSIDSVKIDIARAQLSAKRCGSFRNITYISEDIDKLEFAKSSYDLIIIGQLEDLNLGKQEQITLMSDLQQALSKTGRLVVNVRNRERINKWTSQGLLTTPYRELYLNEVTTDFTQQEIDSTLKQAGFLHWDSYASFSQGQEIQNLLSHEYLAGNPHSLNHFNRLGAIGNDDLNEYLLFKNLNNERGELFDLASRFIIIAGASKTRTQQLCNINFAHFSGLSRKPQWRTTTQCTDGSNEVTKTSLHPEYKTEQDKQTASKRSTLEITQVTAPQEFKQGRLLLDDWLSALLASNPESRLKELIDDYARWLKNLETDGYLESNAYDLLPFNIIVSQQDDNKHFQIIDPEWLVHKEFDSDFILFRALFWFAFENKSLLKKCAQNTGLLTIGLFVLHHMESFNNHEQLIQFVEMEEAIQQQIGMNFRSKSIEYALLQTFDGETANEQLQPACQISWSDKAGNVDERNSIFMQWKPSQEEQTIKSDSPAFVKSKNILRVDPIVSMGLFMFSSLVLKSEDNSIIWQLNSTTEIIDVSNSLNVFSAQNADHELYFIALNEDPHFLFDLSAIKHLEKITSIEVTFSQLHNQYYDSSLAALSNAVGEQNRALFQQVGILDTKQAEIQTLSAKLDHTEQHRQALHNRVHQIQQAHEEHIQSITSSLEEKTKRIHQLEGNLIVRIALKLKRIISNVTGRFSRP